MLAAVVLVFVLCGVSAAATVTGQPLCRFGSTGVAAGQFVAPTDSATDPATGQVLLSDYNNRMFAKAWGLQASKAGGQGILTTSPGGLSCGSTCLSATALYKQGPVTVKEKPAKHFHFVEFTGATGSASSCSGVTTETCAFAIAADSSVEALFAEDAKNTLSYSAEGGGQGSVKTTPANVNCGYTCGSAQARFYASEEPEVTVTLNKGTGQVTWESGAGTCTGHALSCKLPMSSAHSLVARFE